MRVESHRPTKNGGWLHKREADPSSRRVHTVRQPPSPSRAQDFGILIKRWQTATNGQLDQLGRDTGIKSSCYRALGAAYAEPYRAFAFPMVKPSGEVVGIRLRSDTRKYAVTGSKQGLFIPFERADRQRLLICEGPTDTAAGLMLGYFAVGRPACLGCEDMLVELVRELSCPEAIIVSDCDEPGVRGAEKLAGMLPCRAAIIIQPAKDLRAFVVCEGSAAVFAGMVEKVVRRVH